MKQDRDMSKSTYKEMPKAIILFFKCKTGPESLFEAELSTIFTQNYIFNYQNKHKAGWLKLMTEFEHAKNRFDPLSKQNYYVFVPSSFVDHFRRFTSMEVS